MIILAVQDEGRDPKAPRGERADAPLLESGFGSEAGRRHLDAERVVDGRRRDRRVTRARIGASRFFQAGSVESSAGAVNTARSGAGRSVRR